jgi:hypothetical protein
MPSNNYDDDDFDERGILKDGRTVKVSFMDSMRARGWAPPDQRPGGPFVQDYRRDGWAPIDRRRPLSDAEMQDARQEIADAYADYDYADSQRWRRPPNGPPLRDACEFGAGSRMPEGAYPLSAGEGSRCTINGQDGRLAREGDWLVCRPTSSNDAQPRVGDQRFVVTDAALRTREQAYRDADEADRDAWKRPR